jgi:hypothetical protein
MPERPDVLTLPVQGGTTVTQVDLDELAAALGTPDVQHVLHGYSFTVQDQARAILAALPDAVPVAAITGKLLHRAWLKSGRPDPLLDDDAWDGFALTVQAVAQREGLPR